MIDPTEARVTKTEELGRKAPTAREALAELVACKDLKERADSISPVEQGCEKELLMIEYRRRKPLAWSAARAALAQEPAQKVTQVGYAYLIDDAPPADDLVRRLRDWTADSKIDPDEAATAIAALQAEVARLTHANEQLFRHGERMYADRETAEARAAELDAEVAQLQETGIGRTRSKLYNEMADRAEAAEARAAAAEGDARRYRWLRQCKAGQWEWLNNRVRIDKGMVALDAAIDKGIAKDDDVPAEIWMPEDARAAIAAQAGKERK